MKLPRPSLVLRGRWLRLVTALAAFRPLGRLVLRLMERDNLIADMRQADPRRLSAPSRARREGVPK